MGEEELAKAQGETRAAFENRALMYAYLYDELADELGAERATAVMKRAIHRRGVEVGRAYADAAAAGDLTRVGEIFCESSPCGGALFHAGVEAESEAEIVLRMTSCPLLEAWQKAGYEGEERNRLCEIAAEVDEGTFGGAGLELTFLERLGQPGATRCLLRLRAR